MAHKAQHDFSPVSHFGPLFFSSPKLLLSTYTGCPSLPVSHQAHSCLGPLYRVFPLSGLSSSSFFQDQFSSFITFPGKRSLTTFSKVIALSITLFYFLYITVLYEIICLLVYYPSPLQNVSSVRLTHCLLIHCCDLINFPNRLALIDIC